MPIGECIFGRPTKAGIGFEAKIPKISEPGLLKDRLDMAAQEVATGLMRGVSIGFRPTKQPTPNELGGFDYPATEIYELSTCAVPMHQLATIDQIKAIDAAILRGEVAVSPSHESGLKAMIGAAHEASDAKALRDMMGAESDRIIQEAVAEHGKDWAMHAGLGVTARFANILTSFMVGKFAEIEHRLNAQGRSYKGIWKPGTYCAGSFVTHGGSMWHADTQTDFKPGEGGGWTLAVKKGADAKQ
jgi:hypothetical protein